MKKEIAFFLGAGVSKSFGLSLTSEIFPKFWKNLWKDYKGDGDQFLLPHQRVALKERFFKTLYPGLNKDTPDEHLPGITEILSQLDNFINNHTIPLKQLKYHELLEFRHALEFGVVTVIEENFFTYDEEDPQDQLYDKFLNYLVELSKACKVNIITTNYDLLIEYGLFEWFVKDKGDERQQRLFREKVDFGIRWRDPFGEESVMYNPPTNPDFSIYKLHGSTNWLTCDLCNQIYINFYGSIYDKINLETIENSNTCHCGHAKLSSVIVSPSMERIVSNANLKYIWNSALESLRTSEEWIIAGYSLPSEDLNIRSILTRAFEGSTEKPKIKIVQHGKAAEPRFKGFFGDIDYEPGGMEEYIGSM